MKYKKFFLLLLFVSLSISCGKNEKDPIQDTLTEEMQNTDKMSIQQKIDFLKEKKLKYESKAINLENQAQRLQFEEGQLQDAKRYWREAEINRRIAEELQKKIEELEKSK